MLMLIMYRNLSVFSVIDDTTKEIVYRDYVDISVAVATPKVTQVYYDVVGQCYYYYFDGFFECLS